WRLAGALAAEAARAVRAASVALALPETPADAGALVEGFVLGAYRFTAYREDEAPTPALTLLGPEHLAGAVRAARVRAEAACAARDLVNLSPDEKTPALLAARMAAEAEAAGLHAEVWDRARIEAERMGGLLAVNRGSQDPPAFVVLEHAPEGAAKEAPIVLVGKAVTFDTGGLSLKPTKDSMDRMKADMAGGAAVFGAMLGAARLGYPQRLLALIPMTDNRPGGRAYVPGDVVRMRSGATVEVLNTDAEGRLLLADALAYAATLAPRLVVDVATLTGAQVVALGSRVAAAVTRLDDGAEARLAPFVAAGRATGELVAPLPLYAHYREQLESAVADLANVGGPEAGTLAAAAFLEHFTRREDGTPAYAWVHLDIAAPAFLAKGFGYRPRGGTGFGTRLLLDALGRVGP
ncbi:MAG: leucyl aminopeptidase family protein, partial [Rubricoccaceae bacterium]